MVSGEWRMVNGEGLTRGGFDTAQERWKESISFLAYSTTGLTLPVMALFHAKAQR